MFKDCRRFPLDWRLLTADQKLTRLTLPQANLAIFEADQDSFPDRFFTHDKRWVKNHNTIDAVEEITSKMVELMTGNIMPIC